MSETSATATRAVVDFVTRASLASFPAEAIRVGKRCVIDGVGVVLAGSTTEASRILREYVAVLGGRPEASVAGAGVLRAPAALAALVNGTSGHAHDFDDTQLSETPDRIFGLLTHPTVPPLAAALAVGEREGAPGAAFLEAFLTGFEVECKIAEAIDPAHYKRGFHSSGTAGTFGAAAAAAKLLKLDPGGVTRTLGIAASLASGIRTNFGTMTKPLHVGRAGHNGVMAADLAARGFTGSATALDGPWGYFQVLGGGFDADKIVGRLGSPHTIVSPGVSIKPYPCGVLGHPSMDAMLALVTEHDVRPEQIAAIRLRAGSNILNPLRYPIARTELEAKFCPAFMLASIAIRRKAGVHEFTDAFVATQPVQEMMRKVRTIQDPDIEARGFDRIRSIVEVDLADGRTLVQAADERYRGGPERPFTADELREKFTECASLALPEASVEKALQVIDAVERLEHLGPLLSIMSPAASPAPR